MAVDRYTLYAIEVNGTLIDQIDEQTNTSGVQRIARSADGAATPTYTAVMRADPRFTFRTTDIKAVLDLIDLNDGLAIASGVNIYYQKLAEDGKRASGSVHRKVATAAAGGLVVVRPISASVGEVAMVELEVFVKSSDGDPLTWTNNAALPAGGGGVASLWTVGPVQINGTKYDGVRSVSVDPGIEVLAEASDGLVYPNFINITQQVPSISATIRNLAVADLLKNAGAAQGGVASESYVWLRKIDEGGKRVADATQEHIQFEVHEGLWNYEQVSGAHPDMQECAVSCQPTDDETNAIVVVDTTAAI